MSYKVGDRVIGTEDAPRGLAGIHGTVRVVERGSFVARVDFDSSGAEGDDGKGWLVHENEIAFLERPMQVVTQWSRDGSNVRNATPEEVAAFDRRQVERRDEAQAQFGKASNPKDAIGSRKVPNSVVPQNVMALVACGLSEGAGKYGRHNYRGAGVRASVYYDGNRRHMDDWWEGEDIDPDSQLHHVIKAICSNIVLADSILRGNMTDDRPPPSPKGWMAEANVHAARMVDKAKTFAEKNGAPHHWTINDEIPS